jgi:hypothetical protein
MNKNKVLLASSFILYPSSFFSRSCPKGMIPSPLFIGCLSAGQSVRNPFTALAPPSAFRRKPDLPGVTPG